MNNKNKLAFHSFQIQSGQLNTMRNILFNFCIILTLICPTLLRAQSIPVGTPMLEDAYRRAQLMGKIDSSFSFCSRPIFPSEAFKVENVFDPGNDLSTKSWNKRKDVSFDFDHNKGHIELLPFTWINQYNSNYPYGWNDGLMIPARGYQKMVSGGFFAKYGWFQIQFRPEYVSAENKDFNGFPKEFRDQIWYEYSEIYNFIDLPEKFGNEKYEKTSWGQSSIRLNIGPASIGLSNENLWWGPGMRNSLTMSNNADGFKHFTLNTVKPIKTSIGSFEGQIIMGTLKNSGFTPFDPLRRFSNNILYIPKRNEDRYINAMVATYQPKWVPGLFLGLIRSFTKYHSKKDSSYQSLTPIFYAMDRKYDLSSGNLIPDYSDQRVSAFARWLWAPAHAEVYFEFMREDHPQNWRDFFLQMDYSRAYIFGFRKLIPLNKAQGQSIQVNLELTQLQQTNNDPTIPYRYLYISRETTQGYTNNGQLLGPGIGVGSNLQSLSISWVKGLNLIGLQFERFVHDNDFHNFVIKDYRHNWVDLTITGTLQWTWRNLLFSSDLTWVDTYNYQHYFTPVDPTDTSWWAKGKNVYNFHGNVSLSYRF